MPDISSLGATSVVAVDSIEHSAYAGGWCWVAGGQVVIVGQVVRSGLQGRITDMSAVCGRTDLLCLCDGTAVAFVGPQQPPCVVQVDAVKASAVRINGVYTLACIDRHGAASLLSLSADFSVTQHTPFPSEDSYKATHVLCSTQHIVVAFARRRLVMLCAINGLTPANHSITLPEGHRIADLQRHKTGFVVLSECAVRPSTAMHAPKRPIVTEMSMQPPVTVATITPSDLLSGRLHCEDAPPSRTLLELHDPTPSLADVVAGTAGLQEYKTAPLNAIVGSGGRYAASALPGQFASLRHKEAKLSLVTLTDSGPRLTQLTELHYVSHPATSLHCQALGDSIFFSVNSLYVMRKGGLEVLTNHDNEGRGADVIDMAVEGAKCTVLHGVRKAAGEGAEGQFIFSGSNVARESVKQTVIAQEGAGVGGGPLTKGVEEVVLHVLDTMVGTMEALLVKHLAPIEERIAGIEARLEASQL